MLLSEVSIGEKFKKIFMSSGIVALYPPQELIVKSKVFSGKNGLLVTPTASGKTFAAELLMAKHLEMGGKIVYVTPLKALAYEKYLEFKKYENLGYKVALEIGDLDASNLPRTLSFDILVVTAEKCDSMLRSRARLFDGVSLLIVDEIHLLATDRGPVYEIIITKFRKLLKDLQILGLSATIGNPEEIANWLDAELIISEWRPVPLKEEVIVAKDKFKKTISIVENTLNDGGQVLIFTTSRKSCESLAEKIANTLNLSSGLEKELKEISASILEAVNTPTEQCKKLASCVAKGVGFHHAGITNAQRMIIEDSFKDGSLKVIVSTPTLAAGVNLPSRVVIIYSLKRYDNFSSRYIAVMEYKQQAGRAGRPRYDNFGISYVLASSNSEKDFIMEKYINGKPESIFSRLGVEPVLRFHVLALIATSHLLKMDSILDFFKETFFG
ncbi:MAG TPA: DEAD/DEAH box helicase, partial [Candidatus Altiarchaeales archaeon]|nr:DEAD/DEAH box helicase [Candidatus Altiarchaeales archaeon]